MGLFDNLFKARPDAADEAVIEAAKRIAEHEKARLLEAARLSPATPTARTGIVPAPKPGSVPAARAYAPRTLGHIVTPARGAGDSAHISPRKIRMSGHEDPARPSEIILTVEDILPRIPMELISDATHDLRQELRFKIEDLSADIARGRAAVPLGRIAAQVPGIFREPIASDDPRQVRLPLQKLVEQIGFLPIKSAAPIDLPPAPEFTPQPEPAPALPAEPARPADATPLPSNVRISLSLAAVLRNCPRDLIVAELPPIPEDDRISFPWAPIEKQLPTGQIEVSSVRFIFALPAYLQGYFEAREGIRVTLPIDEVLDNIPTHSQPPPAPAHAEPEPPASEPAAEESAATPTEPESSPAPEDPAPEAHGPNSEDEESAHPFELPSPIVTHAPPILTPEPSAPEPIPVIAEIEAPEAIEPPEVSFPPPPIFVPPPLRQEGESVAPAVEQPLAPPNVWMQPPHELASRPATPWPPDVAPPPSPILPTRIAAPPIARPLVPPPPIFTTSIEEPAAPAPTPTPEPPRPLDLEIARAALGLEGEATLDELAAALVPLPGLSACLLSARHENGRSGDFPSGFDEARALALARQFATALDDSAESLAAGRVQHLTIFADNVCVSFFTHGEATVCAIHRTRAFLPGVRERLAAAAAALTQA